MATLKIHVFKLSQTSAAIASASSAIARHPSVSDVSATFCFHRSSCPAQLGSAPAHSTGTTALSHQSIMWRSHDGSILRMVRWTVRRTARCTVRCCVRCPSMGPVNVRRMSAGRDKSDPTPDCPPDKGRGLILQHVAYRYVTCMLLLDTVVMIPHCQLRGINDFPFFRILGHRKERHFSWLRRQ
jgi:hypothetical protein